MNADAANAPRDVVWKPAGIGMSNLFKCAACHKPRLMLGRRMRMVLGLKTWVCSRCAEGPR